MLEGPRDPLRPCYPSALPAVSTFAHESRSPTARFQTRRPGALSFASTLKYPFRSNCQRLPGSAAPPEELRGRVVTTFKVDAEGVVSGARVQESSIKAAGVARCIAAAHNGLRLYKKPGQPMDAQSRYEIE